MHGCVCVCALWPDAILFTKASGLQTLASRPSQGRSLLLSDGRSEFVNTTAAYASAAYSSTIALLRTELHRTTAPQIVAEEFWLHSGLLPLFFCLFFCDYFP